MYRLAHEATYTGDVGRRRTASLCVWPKTGPDDIWCQVHRQVAPELRELVGLAPCVTRLPSEDLLAWGDRIVLAGRRDRPDLLHAITQALTERCLDPGCGEAGYIGSQLGGWVRLLPADQLDWARSNPLYEVRSALVQRGDITDVDWARNDPEGLVRAEAARRWPPDSLGWARDDPDPMVRYEAALRWPPGDLGWARDDPHWRVRKAAAIRMPVSQLEWAKTDPDAFVRAAVARRMSPQQLADWATQDPDPDVRLIAANRVPLSALSAATTDPDWRVREAALVRLRHPDVA